MTELLIFLDNVAMTGLRLLSLTLVMGHVVFFLFNTVKYMLFEEGLVALGFDQVRDLLQRVVVVLSSLVLKPVGLQVVYLGLVVIQLKI